MIKSTDNEKVISRKPDERKVWNLNFFLLWQGQMVSGIGDFFYLIALGFRILVTTGSTALMTTVTAASFIPQVFIAPFAGILKIWMVLAVGIVLGISLSFFKPAVRSALPDIVPKSKMVKANAAFSMVTASSKIIGDSIGGFLYQALGVPMLLF